MSHTNVNGNGNGHANGKLAITDLPALQPLNHRERAFVLHYASNGWKIKKAVIAAGYKQTPGAASVTGTWLLRKPKIRAAVTAVEKEYHLSAIQVLQRWAEIANVDPSDFLDSKGRISLSAIKAKGYLLRAIKLKDGGVEVIPHDAQVALANIAKHLGLLSERLEVTGADGGALKVETGLAKDEYERV